MIQTHTLHYNQVSIARDVKQHIVNESNHNQTVRVSSSRKHDKNTLGEDHRTVLFPFFSYLHGLTNRRSSVPGSYDLISIEARSSIRRMLKIQLVS